MSQDLRTELLLVMRLRAFAAVPMLVERVGAPEPEVRDELRELDSWGLIRFRDGIASGWTLTPQGRRHGEDLLRNDAVGSGAVAAIDRCYSSFLPLNSEMLSVVTDWQTVVVDGQHVPNDHRDAQRDDVVLARFDRLHQDASPVLTALSGASKRFRGYPDRLDRAHRHVLDGDTEWLAKPTVGSYHGIWFELHEHLLATLGRDRSTEPAPHYAPTDGTDLQNPQNGDPQ